MITAQDFKRQLADDPNDTTIRYIYADWLEEHGETIEAERQRLWCQAKQWLVDFCDRYAQDLSARYGSIGQPITYEKVLYRIEQILVGLDLRQKSVQCSETVSLIRDRKSSPRLWLYFGPTLAFIKAFCGEQGAVFWKNWCIVSDIPLDEGIDKFLYQVFKLTPE